MYRENRLMIPKILALLCPFEFRFKLAKYILLCNLPTLVEIDCPDDGLKDVLQV